MFINNLNPVILNLGPISITWYGLVYAIGFSIATFYLIYKRDKLNLEKDEVYDFMFYFILSSILTARLFYVLFYGLNYYLANPLQIFAFWNGGMSFHGGLVGGIIISYWFSKKKNINFLRLADYLSIPAALMLGFGRIANFINGELVGTPSSLPWCVYFNGEDVCRHPSQLYESAKNFLIFGVLSYLEKKKFKDGTIFFSFVTLYGFLRFFITFYRVAEDYIFGLGTGQWLSLGMGLVGLYFLYQNYKKR